MKAAVLHGKEDIRYEEVETPVVKPGYVKVRVKACGICGSDLPRYFEGRVHAFPLILGHEFSGVVEEIGSLVENISVGDHVVVAPLLPCGKCDACSKGNYSLCTQYSFMGSRCSGALAENILVPAKNIVVIDKNIEFDSAAFFEVSTVALHALKLVKYEGGHTVLVLGTGTVGLMIIQWAKLLGAEKIIAVGRNINSFNLAKEMGADCIVNSLDSDFEIKFNEIKKEYSFKYVFEAAGSTETMHLAFDGAAKKANVCFVGTPVDKLIYEPKDWELINRKEFALTGSWMSYSAPFPGEEWRLMKRYLEGGKFMIPNQLIYKKVQLKNIKEAFDIFKKEKVVGRVLIEI